MAAVSSSGVAPVRMFKLISESKELMTDVLYVLEDAKLVVINNKSIGIVYLIITTAIPRLFYLITRRNYCNA
ncbi:MAG TPA: hypothetical protein EYP18_11170 [Desulfobacterales bacterium]|nr:hypothetical protein [Desulfobacterales bacterium]